MGARGGPVRLTVLGSADAFGSGGRGNAAYLVDDPAGTLAVDFGPTAVLALRRLGRDPQELDAVLLTHLHGDHVGGLPLLFIDAMYGARRTRPLVVAGPPGTRRTVEQLLELAWYRAARKRRPFAMRYLEWRPGDRRDLLGRRVEVMRARHMSPPAVATHLRLETAGRVLAFTGDTAWHEGLIDLARGADLLVTECSAVEAVPKHLGWRDLEPRLGELTARRILLSHLSEASRARVRTRDRRVRVADDGMVVRV